LEDFLANKNIFIMATMRSGLDHKGKPGEKKLYEILKNKLSADYHVWHKINIHKAAMEIDFVVIHPIEGVYVIEVKDWIPENIEFDSSGNLQFVNSKGEKSSEKNPLDQARDHSFFILNELKKKPNLLNKSGKYLGKLIFPVNYGVAFTNISSVTINDRNWSEKLPLNCILDTGFLSEEYLQLQDYEESLRNLRKLNFSNSGGLSEDQWIDISSVLGTTVVQSPNNDSIYGVLDEVQEELVKLNITKTVLFEGPAGSGKSVVLVNRAAYIHQQNPESKIGVFCFNVVMANMLRTLLNKKGILDNIIVDHFENLSDYSWKGETFDAILLDEAQDITDKNLKEIKGLLKTESLSIFYDPKQNIYNRDSLLNKLNDNGLIVEYTKTLIRQQRSPLLLAAQILYNAIMEFDQFDNESIDTKFDQIVQEIFALSDKYFEGFHDPESFNPTGSARHFTMEEQKNTNLSLPNILSTRLEIKQMQYVKEIVNHFIGVIQELVNEGTATYNDFAILYPHRYLRENKFRNDRIIYWVRELFSERQIPVRIIDSGRKKSHEGILIQPPDYEKNIEGDNRNFSFEDNFVRSTTVYQFKGLDAKYVAVIGFENCTELLENNSVDDFDKEKQGKASMVYTALTRAMEKCWVYYIRPNKSVELLISLLSER